MSKTSETRAFKELCKALGMKEEIHDASTIMYIAKSRISRLTKEVEQLKDELLVIRESQEQEGMDRDLVS